MSPAVRILNGLVAGLAAGTALAAGGFAATATVVAGAQIIGELWLDALRMTIVPLVFTLLVTGVASATSAAAAGGVTGRSIGLFGARRAIRAIVRHGSKAPVGRPLNE